MASVKVISWVLVLLALILYIAGIFFTVTVGNAEDGVYPGRDERAVASEGASTFNSFQYFGNLLRSSFTLFNVAMLVEDYDSVSRAVFEKNPTILIFVIGFLMTTTFGVMNVIIGVMVDNTTAATNAIREDLDETWKQEKLDMLMQ